MVLSLAMVVLILAIILFIRDMVEQQEVTSRIESYYVPLRAETVVRHNYIAKPDALWKALTRFDNYHLWFPGINRVLPVLDTQHYAHKTSFDRFSLSPGSYIKHRKRTFLPWLKSRIIAVQPLKKLEMEMRFSPLHKEMVTFEIKSLSPGLYEVVCQRNSHGVFSFLTHWGFARSGSMILDNLARLVPVDKQEDNSTSSQSAASAQPNYSREFIIANALQAALDGNMDLINIIADKPTRGLAKAALVKAKRTGLIPENLKQALSSEPKPASSPQSTNAPSFNSQDDLIDYAVNLGLDGNMDFINAIEDKPLRGKVKAALVKAKRSGERPPMPNPVAASTPSNIASGAESDAEKFDRLVALGVLGNMEEINALEDKAFRGKIKAAVVKAKRQN